MRPKILLVDDHPPNLLALEAVLEGIGADFVQARSGEEALKRLLEHDFALVLLDVQMPGLDGFETAALMRARHASRATPIIFLTAIHRDPAQHLRGYEQGAVDYLLKPFDAHVLRCKVGVFLELWRAKERIKEQEAELRERERELWRRRSQRRYRDLTDAMPALVWAGEPDGRVHFFNRAFVDYAGRIATPTAQSAISDRMHPDDRDAAAEERARAISEGRNHESTFRLRGENGEYRAFLERVFVERDEEGSILGVVGALADIEVLRRAAEEKDAFVAAATHELRTPVAAALAVMQLALRRLAAGREIDAKDVLETSYEQVRRLAKLVDDLLDAGRLSHGGLPLEISEIDLVRVVAEVRDRFTALEPDRRITLEAPATLPLQGDASRLDQVVTNLVGNAVRYSPPSSPIELRVLDDGTQALIAVRDHGIGIPRERQQSIFTRFTRLHGARYGGLGLGLDIALGIVRQHGGDIGVESEGVPGRGSTFTVRLPKRPPTAAE